MWRRLKHSPMSRRLRSSNTVAQSIADIIQENLNDVLNGRAVIEQAKGVLSERYSFAMDDAFMELRDQARQHHRGLVETARDVIEGESPSAPLDAG